MTSPTVPQSVLNREAYLRSQAKTLAGYQSRAQALLDDSRDSLDEEDVARLLRLTELRPPWSGKHVDHMGYVMLLNRCEREAEGPVRTVVVTVRKGVSIIPTWHRSEPDGEPEPIHAPPIPRVRMNRIPEAEPVRNGGFVPIRDIADALRPIIRELAAEGRSNWVVCSPAVATRESTHLRQLLDRWAQRSGQPSRTSISSLAVLAKLTPLVDELEAEGRKHKARYSPIIVGTVAVKLRNQVNAWAGTDVIKRPSGRAPAIVRVRMNRIPEGEAS